MEKDKHVNGITFGKMQAFNLQLDQADKFHSNDRYIKWLESNQSLVEGWLATIKVYDEAETDKPDKDTSIFGYFSYDSTD